MEAHEHIRAGLRGRRLQGREEPLRRGIADALDAQVARHDAGLDAEGQRRYLGAGVQSDPVAARPSTYVHICIRCGMWCHGHAGGVNRRDGLVQREPLVLVQLDL